MALARRRRRRAQLLLFVAVLLLSGAIGTFRLVWYWEPEEKRRGEGPPLLPRDAFEVRHVRLNDRDDDDDQAALGPARYVCIEELGSGRHPVFVLAEGVWPVVQQEVGRERLAGIASAADCRLVAVHLPNFGRALLASDGNSDGATVADVAAAVARLAGRLAGPEQPYSLLACGAFENRVALACAASVPPARLSSVHVVGELAVGQQRDTLLNRLKIELTVKLLRRRVFTDGDAAVASVLAAMPADAAPLLARHRALLLTLLKQSLFDGDAAVADYNMLHWRPHGFDAWRSAGAPIHYWPDSQRLDVPDTVVVHPVRHASGVCLLAADAAEVVRAIAAETTNAKQNL